MILKKITRNRTYYFYLFFILFLLIFFFSASSSFAFLNLSWQPPTLGDNNLTNNLVFFNFTFNGAVNWYLYYQDNQNLESHLIASKIGTVLSPDNVTWNTTIVADNIYLINLTAINYSNNSDKESIFIYNLTIDNNPPEINALPINNSLINNSNITFYFFVTDNIDKNVSCELYLNNFSELNFSNETNSYNKSLKDGIYYYFLICYDDLNQTNKTPNYKFYVDTISPNITSFSITHFYNNSFFALNKTNITNNIIRNDSIINMTFLDLTTNYCLLNYTIFNLSLLNNSNSLSDAIIKNDSIFMDLIITNNTLSNNLSNNLSESYCYFNFSKLNLSDNQLVNLSIFIFDALNHSTKKEMLLYVDNEKPKVKKLILNRTLLTFNNSFLINSSIIGNIKNNTDFNIDDICHVELFQKINNSLYKINNALISNLYYYPFSFNKGICNGTVKINYTDSGDFFLYLFLEDEVDNIGKNYSIITIDNKEPLVNVKTNYTNNLVESTDSIIKLLFNISDQSNITSVILWNKTIKYFISNINSSLDTINTFLINYSDFCDEGACKINYNVTDYFNHTLNSYFYLIYDNDSPIILNEKLYINNNLTNISSYKNFSLISNDSLNKNFSISLWDLLFFNISLSDSSLLTNINSIAFLLKDNIVIKRINLSNANKYANFLFDITPDLEDDFFNLTIDYYDLANKTISSSYFFKVKNYPPKLRNLFLKNRTLLFNNTNYYFSSELFSINTSFYDYGLSNEARISLNGHKFLLDCNNSNIIDITAQDNFSLTNFYENITFNISYNSTNNSIILFYIEKNSSIIFNENLTRNFSGLEIRVNEINFSENKTNLTIIFNNFFNNSCNKVIFFEKDYFNNSINYDGLYDSYNPNSNDFYLEITDNKGNLLRYYLPITFDIFPPEIYLYYVNETNTKNDLLNLSTISFENNTINLSVLIRDQNINKTTIFIDDFNKVFDSYSENLSNTYNFSITLQPGVHKILVNSEDYFFNETRNLTKNHFTNLSKYFFFNAPFNKSAYLNSLYLNNNLIKNYTLLSNNNLINNNDYLNKTIIQVILVTINNSFNQEENISLNITSYGLNLNWNKTLIINNISSSKKDYFLSELGTNITIGINLSENKNILNNDLSYDFDILKKPEENIIIEYYNDTLNNNSFLILDNNDSNLLINNIDNLIALIKGIDNGGPKIKILTNKTILDRYINLSLRIGEFRLKNCSLELKQFYRINNTLYNRSLLNLSFIPKRKGLFYYFNKSTTLDNGDYYFSVSCWDYNNFYSYNSSNFTVIDKKAPVIINNSALPGVYTATIKVSTDELSKITIFYGQSTDSLSPYEINDFKMNHDIDLSHLTPAKKYFYQLKICDIHNNCIFSPIKYFFTEGYEVSSSGGGSFNNVINSFFYGWGNLEKGKYSLIIPKKKNLFIKKIDFYLNNKTFSSSISIMLYKQRPTTIPYLNNSVYYFRIAHKNLPVNNSIIYFSLPKEIKNVSFFRLENNHWKEYKVYLESIKDNDADYFVLLPGLSFFAITGFNNKHNLINKNNIFNNQTNISNNNISDINHKVDGTIINSNSDNLDINNLNNQENLEKPSLINNKKDISFFNLFLLFLLIIAFFALAYYSLLKKDTQIIDITIDPNDAFYELKLFINNSINKGLSKDEIFSLLIKNGWDETMIEEEYKKVLLKRFEES